MKQAVREAGLTLDEVARRIGCSRALIYQYASGASLAQSDRLQQIAAQVGKPLTWFYIGDAEAEPTAQSHPQVSIDSRLAAEREQLAAERARLTAERARLDLRRGEEDIARIEALLAAHSSPPDPRRVVDCCQQLYPLLARGGKESRLAGVLLKQGNAMIALQEWAAARETLDEAGALFRLAGEPVLERDCLQSLGHANLMLGRVEEALRLFEDVAAGEDWANRWQGTMSAGACHEVLGSYAEAIAAFERALEIADERDDMPGTEVARLYIEANWANIELNYGDVSAALARSERCLRSALRLGIQDQYMEALLTSGAARLSQGAVAAAARCFQQALDVAHLTADQQRRSIGLAYQSLCDSALYRSAEAIAGGKEALALAHRCGAVRAEITAQRALSEAYLAAGNGGEALYHARRGAAAAASMRMKYAQAELAVLAARSHLLDGRCADAVSEADRASAIAAGLAARPLQMEATIAATRAALGAGDVAGAEAHARAAAEHASTLDSAAHCWMAAGLLAICAARQGRGDEARAEFERAIATLSNERRGRRRTSEDTYLEGGLAQEIVRSWLSFVAANDGPARAAEAARQMEWPPALDWVEQGTVDHGGSANE